MSMSEVLYFRISTSYWFRLWFNVVAVLAMVVAVVAIVSRRVRVMNVMVRLTTEVNPVRESGPICKDWLALVHNVCDVSLRVAVELDDCSVKLLHLPLPPETRLNVVNVFINLLEKILMSLSIIRRFWPFVTIHPSRRL